MSEFTPGPWLARKTRVVVPGRAGFNGGEYRVADAYSSSAGLSNTPSFSEAEANAKLIAATLDLLAACRALDESAPLDSEYGTCGCCGMRNRHESDCAVILARAAIAKATSPADKANAL